MQNKHATILNQVNRNNRLNILTCPTHERYQSNWSTLEANFWMVSGPGIKVWNDEYAVMPKNHSLIRNGPPGVTFDIVLAQNRYDQLSRLKRVASEIGAPLILLEHTLPDPLWNQKQTREYSKIRGDFNVFISEGCRQAWNGNEDDTVIEHGIDTDLFVDNDTTRSNKLLSVVNDWINRDRFCGWNVYKKLVRGFQLNPVGHTPGFSEAAKDTAELVKKYNESLIFVNTSQVSPVPTSLMEAMACGCCAITTATCDIPSIVKNGYNGFISNDIDYLRDKIQWCLDNPDKARKMGQMARRTIVENYSLSRHCGEWSKFFKRVAQAGKPIKKGIRK